MLVTWHLFDTNNNHLSIYTTRGHNAPPLMMILGHPIEMHRNGGVNAYKIYNYIFGSPSCKYLYRGVYQIWRHISCIYVYIMEMYTYLHINIYHMEAPCWNSKTFWKAKGTHCWCFNRPKACLNSSQRLWDKQPTSLASWQPSWQSCSIPVPGKSTAAQTVFKWGDVFSGIFNVNNTIGSS